MPRIPRRALISQRLRLSANVGGMGVARTLCLFSIACVATAQPAHATEVALKCTAKKWVPEANIVAAPLAPQSIIIDLEHEMITGSLGQFAITKVLDSSIVFQAPYQEQGKIIGQMVGRADRVTGFTTLSATRNEGKTVILIYNLTCKSASRMF